MAFYARIGSTFRVGGAAYLGRVLASPDAFYLAMCSTKHAATAVTIGGILGGAIGKGILGVFTGANLARPMATSESLPTEIQELQEPILTDLTRLPSAVTDHPDWPLTGKVGWAIVIPRGTIVRLRYSLWGSFDLHTNKGVFQVDLSIFHRRQVTEHLKEQGWKF